MHSGFLNIGHAKDLQKICFFTGVYWMFIALLLVRMVAANFEAWNLTKEEMNLLTSQDQVLMDQFPMLNNINEASGLGNLDRWHWLDTPARYDVSFLQRSQLYSL